MVYTRTMNCVDDSRTAAAPFPTQDETGVDLTLLRWTLSMTPHERLLVMERAARDTLRLLEYGRQHREIQARSDR